MKKILIILLCLTVFTCGCNNASEENTILANSDIVKVDTIFHADIIYHVLKYVDIKDSPANLYDKDYINQFEEYRSLNGNSYDLVNKAAGLAGAYAKYFDEVTYIAFCPFYYLSYEDMKKAILNDSSVSAAAMSEFVIPFMECVDAEMHLYKQYWDSTLNESQDKIDEFVHFSNNYFAKLQKVFDYTGKTPQYFLCVSLDNEGRGIDSDQYLGAAVEIPQNSQNMINTFFQAFHEMTHQFTDSKFFSSISMNDGTHLLSEKIVMITDYLLLKELIPDLLDQYIQWTANMAGVTEATEQDFLNFYDLPEEQDLKIDLLINEIL